MYDVVKKYYRPKLSINCSRNAHFGPERQTLKMYSTVTAKIRFSSTSSLFKISLTFFELRKNLM